MSSEFNKISHNFLISPVGAFPSQKNPLYPLDKPPYYMIQFS
nr:MAG TPA: hypothetical protein [Inoviridae sp.]